MCETLWGGAIPKAFSHREDLNLSQAIPCGICDGKDGVWFAFIPSASFSLSIVPPTLHPQILFFCHWQCVNLGVERALKPIPVAERSKVWVCSPSPAGIAGSNPAGGMDVCLLLDRGLFDGPIPRPEDSYGLWCVLVCDFVTSRMRRLQLARVVNFR